jgi:cell division septal protein FtsQ
MSHPGLMIGETTLEPRRNLATRRRSRYQFWRHVTPRVVILLVVVAGIFSLGHWLLTASLFTITRVETGKYRYTTADLLEARLATALGHNIWTWRESDLKVAVESLPWVRRASVRKLLPATLRVEFLEWQPLLAVVPAHPPPGDSTGQLVMLADGHVVSFPADRTGPGLPVLTEVELAAAGAERWRVRDVPVETLLDLVAAIAATGLEARKPVDFILPVDEGFRLILQDEKRTLLVGKHDIADQLQNFLLTVEQDDGVSDIDLRCRGKVIFKLEPDRV